MTTTGRGDFDLGGSLRAMPNFSGFRNRFLRIVVVVLLLILLFSSTTSIPTGNVGVLTLFGRVTGDVLGEGIHLINPLKAVKKLSVQTQSVKDTANALYTNARELVQQQIQDELTTQLAARGVIVEAVLLRDVQLPAMLKGSIEAKQQAEQDALRMSFILQKEKQGAERKRIEAQGIADFQKIVAQGISPQLLEWKGIEATEKLALSSNTKIVVIGNPKNGLPLVLEPK